MVKDLTLEKLWRVMYFMYRAEDWDFSDCIMSALKADFYIFNENFAVIYEPDIIELYVAKDGKIVNSYGIDEICADTEEIKLFLDKLLNS